MISEAKLGGIKKVIKSWQQAQLKVAKQFEKQIKAAVEKENDLEALENFRDMELNNMAITDELAYAIRDVVDRRIDDLWAEMIASEK